MPQGPRTPEGYKKAREDTDKELALIKAVAEQNPKLAELAYSPAHVRRITSEGKFAAYLLPQTSDRSSPATFFEVFSIAYTDSGRLLPLKAIGAGIDFIHIFRIVVVAKNKVGLAQADSENQSAGIMKLMSVGFKIR